MKLQLERPIVFLDIEATGISPHTDRIVELSMIKIHPSGRRETYLQRFNPEMPIHPEATAVHGITNEDVADCPTIAEEAQVIVQFLEGADLAGFNAVRFDVPMLQNELRRVGMEINLLERRLVDVQRIFHIKEPRDLSAAYRFYCGKELTNAHSAEGDVVATIEVLEAQLERYDDLPRTVEGLYDFIGRPFDRMADASRRFIIREGRTIINFGKYKGRDAEEVFADEPDFYHWMMNADFPPDTKEVASQVFEKVHGKGTRRTTTVMDEIDRAAVEAQPKPADVLGKFVYDESGEVVFNFGKYRGRKVVEVFRENPGYYEWMTGRDFHEDTLRVAREAFERAQGGDDEATPSSPVQGDEADDLPF